MQELRPLGGALDGPARREEELRRARLRTDARLRSAPSAPCHRLCGLERAGKGEGWLVLQRSLARCQALWEATPLTTHRGAHMCSLQDRALAVEIGATLPFLPVSTYLAIMLQGLESIQTTRFSQPPCAAGTERDRMYAISAVLSSCCLELTFI